MTSGYIRGERNDGRTDPPLDLRPTGSDVDAGSNVTASRWEGLSAGELAERWGVPEVHLFAEVGSTNDIARGLADSGASSGTTVLAESQRTGRGRAGRNWVSAPGLGLWVSLVLRSKDWTDPFTLPLATAVAIAGALDRWLDGEEIRIKWPNDLLLRDRKLGGILCEGAWSEGHLNHVVVGIGLNLLHRDTDFPDDLRDGAISLRAVSRRPLSRLELAGDVLGSVRTMIASGRLELVSRELSRRDALAGRWVEVLEPETGRLLLSGRAAGITAGGSLELQTSEGRKEVRSGTIRLVEERA